MRTVPASRGFTLIELLVVIAIIGLLSSVVLASLNTARSKARDAQRRSDFEQIVLALNLYYDSYGHYPLSGPCRSDSWCLDTWTTNWIPGLEQFLTIQPHNPTPYGTGLVPYHYYSPSGQAYFFGVGMENPGGTCGAGVPAIWLDGTTNVCSWWGGNLYSKMSTN